MSIIQELEAKQLKTDLPDINPGDQIRVSLKIVEGSKERIQNYEGVVVRIQGSGITRSVVVRRIVSQIGVEKSFPLHSPRVTEIKIIRRGKVRRSRLYYLRERFGRKATRIAEKRTTTSEKGTKATLATEAPVSDVTTAAPADAASSEASVKESKKAESIKQKKDTKKKPEKKATEAKADSKEKKTDKASKKKASDK